MITLHRPYVQHTRSEDLTGEELAWAKQSHQKARTAATNINFILERLIDIDMIRYLKPMTYVDENRCLYLVFYAYIHKCYSDDSGNGNTPPRNHLREPAFS